MDKSHTISIDEDEDILAPIEGISRPQGGSVRKTSSASISNVSNNIKTQKENININNNATSNLQSARIPPVTTNIHKPPPTKISISAVPIAAPNPAQINPTRSVPSIIPKHSISSSVAALNFFNSLQNQVDPQQYQQVMSALSRVNSSTTVPPLPIKTTQLPVQPTKKRKTSAPSFVHQPSDVQDLTNFSQPSIQRTNSMPTLIDEPIRKSSIPDIKNIPLPIKPDPMLHNNNNNNNLRSNNNTNDSEYIDLTNLEDEEASLPQNTGALNLDTRNAFSPSTILARNKQVQQQELQPEPDLYDMEDEGSTVSNGSYQFRL